MKNGDKVLILDCGGRYNHIGRIDAIYAPTGDALVRDLISNDTIEINLKYLKPVIGKKHIKEEDLIL